MTLDHGLTRTIATQQQGRLRAQACRDALAAVARCCAPSGWQVGWRQVRRAGTATLAWLRKGQLGPGYVAPGSWRDCCA